MIFCIQSTSKVPMASSFRGTRNTPPARPHNTSAVGSRLGDPRFYDDGFTPNASCLDIKCDVYCKRTYSLSATC